MARHFGLTHAAPFVTERDPDRDANHAFCRFVWTVIGIVGAFLVVAPIIFLVWLS